MHALLLGLANKEMEMLPEQDTSVQPYDASFAYNAQKLWPLSPFLVFCILENEWNSD